MMTPVEAVRNGMGFDEVGRWHEAKVIRMPAPRRDDDPLAPARGAIYGLLAGSVLWGSPPARSAPAAPPPVGHFGQGMPGDRTRVGPSIAPFSDRASANLTQARPPRPTETGRMFPESRLSVGLRQRTSQGATFANQRSRAAI
jgi:hypothetical protein